MENNYSSCLMLETLGTGEFLAFRNSLGLSREALAMLYGISPQAVRMLEDGDRCPEAAPVTVFLDQHVLASQ